MPQPTPDDPLQKWQTLSSSIALPEPWFQIRRNEIRLPTGRIVNDYFTWDAPSIVVIVPVTSEGAFVLCEQYRYGVDKIMHQFPAGCIDPGESPEAAASRELEEETGYMASEFESLGSVCSNPTKSTAWHHLFLARNVRLTGLRHENEMEQTRVVCKTPDELWSMIHENQFQVSDSLNAALLAFNRLSL